MYALLGPLIAKIGMSLLTEKLLKEVFVHTAWFLAKKSTNDLDDEWVKSAAEALSVQINLPKQEK